MNNRYFEEDFYAPKRDKKSHSDGGYQLRLNEKEREMLDFVKLKTGKSVAKILKKGIEIQYKKCKSDRFAKEIMADIAGMSTDDSVDAIASKIIFGGGNKNEKTWATAD